MKERLLLAVAALIFVLSAGMPLASGHGEQPALDDSGRYALANCESTNDPTARTYYVRDPNSFGLYQFEFETWQAALGWMVEAGYAGAYDWLQWSEMTADKVPVAIQHHVVSWLWVNDREHRHFQRWPNCWRGAVAAIGSGTQDDLLRVFVQGVEAPIPSFTG